MNTTGRKTVKGRTTSAPKKVEKAVEKAPPSKSANTTSPDTMETASEVASNATMGLTSGVASEAKPAPTHEQIAQRAYELYLARGSEPGHEREDWLLAEAQLGSAGG